MFKKIVFIVYIISSLIVFFGCQKNKEIKLFNAGEYLMPELKDEFYKKTGIRINEITFDSNEIALTSFKAGNKYDMAVLSEYAIDNLKNAQLNNEDILIPIDWSRITSVKETDYADQLLRVNNLFEDNKKYNLLDYAIPYFWGDFGILYNKDKISTEKVEQLEWDVLKETKAMDGTKLKVAIYDSAADLFTTALKAKDNPKKISTATEDDVLSAREWLNSIPKANRNFITDEIFDDIPNGIYDLTLAYLGDAVEIMNRIEEENININLGYYAPQKKGTNVWLDGIVLPKNTDEQLNYVYQFINFLFEEKNAEDSAKELGYPSPIKSVLAKQIEDSSDKVKEILNVKIGKNHELQVYDPKTQHKLLFEWVVFRCS